MSNFFENSNIDTLKFYFSVYDENTIPNDINEIVNSLYRRAKNNKIKASDLFNMLYTLGRVENFGQVLRIAYNA